MVLEFLISVAGARKHSWKMLLCAIVLSSAGLWSGYLIFPEYSSILSLAFVTIGIMPVLHTIFIQEEDQEARAKRLGLGFIGRHLDIVSIYVWLTIGLIVSYSFWYVALPETAPAECLAGKGGWACMVPVKEKVFREQNRTYAAITGRATKGIGAAECKDPATRDLGKCTMLIFNNNAFVLGLAIVFSFIYGAGAILLIGWNASVIGCFIGKEVIDVHILAGIAKAVGYLPHGIPELLGYFIGAVAGGIISVAISRRTYRRHELERVAKDALLLIVLAYAVLFFGAAIESWLIVSG